MKKLYALILIMLAPNLLATRDYKKDAFAYALEDNWKPIREMIYKKQLDVNAQNNEGYSLLYMAANERNEDAIKRLLFYNADVNAGKETPLTRTLEKIVERQDVPQEFIDTSTRILRALVNKGARVSDEDLALIDQIENEQTRNTVRRILERVTVLTQ